MLDGLTASKLLAAVNDDWQSLSRARQGRKDAYTRLRTRHHPGPAAKDTIEDRNARRPVNLNYQQVRTIITHTAHQQGAAEIKPLRGGLDMEAELWQLVADQASERAGIIDTLQMAVFDTVLSGVCFLDTGLRASRGMLAATDGDADPGETYTKLRTLDEYACDCTVRRHTDASREAIRYAVSRAELKRVPLGLPPGATPYPDLVATPEEAAQIIASLPDMDSSRTQGRTGAIDTQAASAWKADPKVELWDVFLYCGGETFVAIIPAGDNDQAVFKSNVPKVLHLERYDGPGRSRLSRLCFIEDPEAPVPTSLDGFQRDIAILADLLATKAFNQAIRMKRNKVVRPGNEALAKAIATAMPDEYVFGDPEAVTDVTSAGLVSESLEAYVAALGAWDQASGAVALTGGLRGPANQKTATAFDGLMTMASGYLQFLQRRVVGLASDELNKRMRLMMGDPLAVHQLGYRLDEDLMVDVEWTPAMRRGRYEDFTFKINAGSMPFEDPNVGARRTIELYGDVLPKVLDACFKYALNPRLVLRKLGRQLRQPDLYEVVGDAQMLAMQQMAVQAAAGGQPTRAGIVNNWGGDPAAGAAGVPEAQSGDERGIDEVRSAMSRRVPV